MGVGVLLLVGRGVGVRVLVGTSVSVGFTVFVGVTIFSGDGESVGVNVGDGESVGDAVKVGTLVYVGVGVGVGSGSHLGRVLKPYPPPTSESANVAPANARRTVALQSIGVFKFANAARISVAV